MVTALDGLDLESLSADDRLFVVEAWERVNAWATARAYQAVAAFAGPEDSDGLELAREELAAALGWGRGTAQIRIEHARALTQRLPGTLELMRRGKISGKHATAMIEACEDLPPEAAAEVERRVLERAPGQTVAQFRRAARRAATAADPRSAELAHQVAAAKRRVVMWSEAHGMATLAATLPAADARAVFLALDELARVEPDDALGIDARRADALVALANTALDQVGMPLAHGRRVAVQIVMDLPTALGLADHPAELVGYGPIPAPVARELATDANWTRLVNDPITGQLLDHGTQTYRPSQRLKDYLVARDQSCQFPGCAQPAARAELDHIEPFDPGATSAENMAALCKRHHQIKTHHRWRLTRAPDGSLVWKSPLGREHRVRPTDHRPQGP